MAVYTHVSETELVSFLEDYDIGSLKSFCGIEAGVENSNYYLETDKDRYILTLFEKRVQEDDLPFFMDLMEHLLSKGLKTAAPVADSVGAYLKHLNGRPAAIISFLEGQDRKEPDEQDCTACGTLMAQLHHATTDFQSTRTNNLSLNGWQQLAEKCGAEADTCEQGLATFIDKELAFLGERWPASNTLPAGVVHADLFPDNVMFSGEKLTGAFDFYFACTDFYAYDLAITLNAWCFDENHQFQRAHARAMLNAYQKIRSLNDAERSALPLFLRGACLRFLLTRLYDWLNQDPNALVKVKDPLEYLTKSRFHQENDFWELLK